MNVFQLIADMLHLFSIIVLILKIRQTKNVLGISYRTQEIFMVVFIMRYWDLFLYFISLYNSSMKLIYLSATAYTIHLMRRKKPYCLSYDKTNDAFDHYKFIYPLAAVCTFFVHSGVRTFDLSWSYSIWLEAFAIYPQLHMIMKIKEVENITSNYMACLGFYRFFYIINWYTFYLGFIRSTQLNMSVIPVLSEELFKPFCMVISFIIILRVLANKSFIFLFDQQIIYEQINNIFIQMKQPKIFVFDLDNCVWYPEMYMLWGGGPPFKYDGTDIIDSKNTKIKLLGHIKQFITDFAQNKYPNSKLAIASKCDEPEWARDCLSLFKIENKPLKDYFTYQQIQKGSKQIHLKNIQKQSQIDFNEMVFFDDQQGNITDVSKLGVISILTPDGFEKRHLDLAIQIFNQQKQL